MEVVRPVRGSLAWGRMARAALGVGVPLAAGLITGGIVPGVLIALGGLLGALADRPVPCPARMRATALAGVSGATGLFLGAAIHGRGWVVVAVLVLVAGVSALLTSAGGTRSGTGFCLLLYAALGAGPLEAFQPWWLPTPLFLAGVCWALLLLVPEWSLRWKVVLILLPEWLLRSNAVERARIRLSRPAESPARRWHLRPGALLRRLAARVQEARLTFNAVAGVRLMLCVAVAAILTEVLPLGGSYWILLAVVLVVKPEFGSTIARALHYATGTAVGALIGALVVAFGPPEAVLLALAVIVAALLPFGTRCNFGFVALLLTTLLILLFYAVTPGGGLPLAEAWLLEIALGCAIALGIGYAPWPWTWHDRLPRVFARAVDGTADYLESTLPISPISPATAQARAEQRVAAVQVELRRGMIEPDHAQPRVAVWRPATDALQRLLDAVTATRASGAEPPPPTEVALVNESLRHIAAAARSGDPPPRDLSLTAWPPLEPVTESVRSLSHALDGGAGG